MLKFKANVQSAIYDENFNEFTIAFTRELSQSEIDLVNLVIGCNSQFLIEDEQTLNEKLQIHTKEHFDELVEYDSDFVEVVEWIE
jgi:hypothetical protein